MVYIEDIPELWWLLAWYPTVRWRELNTLVPAGGINSFESKVFINGKASFVRNSAAQDGGEHQQSRIFGVVRKKPARGGM